MIDEVRAVRIFVVAHPDLGDVAFYGIFADSGSAAMRVYRGTREGFEAVLASGYAFNFV